MVSGDASMAVIYSGDATVAMEENEDLDYVVPKEGSNVWFDCFLIPKTAEHKEAAEKFIDYMNRQDIAQKNFDYIYYGTPNKAVYDTLDDDTKEDYTIFPEEATLINAKYINILVKRQISIIIGCGRNWNRINIFLSGR